MKMNREENENKLHKNKIKMSGSVNEIKSRFLALNEISQLKGKAFLDILQVN